MKIVEIVPVKVQDRAKFIEITPKIVQIKYCKIYFKKIHKIG